ncbi:MAG: HEAT repeat domain-containing protein, partial [Vicinamibacteria bacterium]
VKRKPSSNPAALAIFQEAIAQETDPWTSSMAAQGIGVLLGPDAKQAAQRKLLRREPLEVVARAILEIDSKEMATDVLEALERCRDPRVTRAAIYTLGRLRDERAFPVLVGFLAMPEFRSYAVSALGEFGDLRAIAYLEPFERDDTRLPELDDRGAVITLADIVGPAIRRVRYINSGIPSGTTSAGTVPSPAARVSSVTSRRWLIFVPLALACAEVPWAIAIVLYLLGHPGPAERTAAIARTHSFDLLASVPAVAGLLAGLWLLVVVRLKDRASYAWVLGGCALCLPALYLFGSEFLRNR